MTISDEKLKACPFCGSDAIARELGAFNELYSMQWNCARCQDCKARGPFVADSTAGVTNNWKDQWNTRPTRQAWISVSERLPTKGNYLVHAQTDDGALITSMYFNGKDWEHEGEPTYCHSWYCKVFFWMPFDALPQPPQPKAGDE
jgi:hypothetical protein